MTAPTSEARQLHPLAKFALELGPLVIFFFVNARMGIFQATAAFMVATAISLAASWFLTRKVAIMPLVSAFVVAIFGGLTLYLQDDLFIKLKPTIINTLFGFTLLGGLLFGKSLLAYVFEDAFKLTDEGWKILTFRWALFFLFLAIIKEVVWRTQTTDFWVGFKVWGIMPITIVFALMQVKILQEHSLDKD